MLHLVQHFRAIETHRFAVVLSPSRRGARQTIRAAGYSGIGPRTFAKIVGKRMGSVANLKKAARKELSRMLPRKMAEKICATFVRCTRYSLPVCGKVGLGRCWRRSDACVYVLFG